MEKLLGLLNNKKSRNFFIYGLGQGFNLVSPLLVVPHIIATCGEKGLGKVGVGFALALFLILIVDYAFDVKSIKQVSENRDNLQELQKIVSTTVSSKFFLFFIAMGIAVLLVYTIPFFAKEKALFLLSMSIVFAQVFNPAWFLQGIEDYTTASLVNIASKAAYVLLVYILVNQTNDYIWVNFYLGMGTLAFNIIGLMAMRYRHKIVPVRAGSNEIRSILRADFTFCLSQLFVSARQLSPIFIIGFFFGYYVAGQYRLLEQVISVFRTFMQVFQRYFYPIACYRYANEQTDGVTFWKKYSFAEFLSVILLCALVYIFTTEILVFFNASAETIHMLTPLVRLSLIICMLMAVSMPLEQLMFITGRNKSYIKTTITITAISVLLLLVLVNLYSITGAIIAIAVAEVLFIILYFKNSYLHLSRKTTQ
jgi:O-antigen/teichoic acid export membrane protein